MSAASVHTLNLPARHTDTDLSEAVARLAGTSPEALSRQDYRIVRRSLDARDKQRIHWVYRIELNPAPLRLEGIGGLMADKTVLRPGRTEPVPVVVGSGPAGLFAALYLALAGQQPVVIERGRPVEQRTADVARFWTEGILDPSSNVQFGEGGAGTFSDGKLTSGIKDSRCRAVLEELVLAGAPEEILWLARPHVGTDRLRNVVVALRRKIIQYGGSFRFSCRLTGLIRDGHRLQGLVCETTAADGSSRSEELPASRVILAIGHSARDTFAMLEQNRLPMERKPFSIGVRIEHAQSVIDKAQYGPVTGLPPAEYQLACHLDHGRSVYTFCMCPGGHVITASSEAETVVTNGMSLQARDGCNANSAVLVTVTPDDFPGEGPLAGIVWQHELERQAFVLAGRSYAAPAQRIGTFLRPGVLRSGAGRSPELLSGPDIQPTCRPGVAWCDLTDLLPSFVSESLQQALPILARRLTGFADPSAILTGIETRSSAPLRILRSQQLVSGLAGLYPAGEGSGYAGGILSAAVDGLRTAEALLQRAR